MNTYLILRILFLFGSISMTVSVISLTVTKTKIFKPLRVYIKRKRSEVIKAGWILKYGKQNVLENPLFEQKLSASVKDDFFYGLISCPYCFSFYVSAFIVTIYHSYLRFIYYFAPTDYLISYFCIIGIASLFTGLIYKSINSIE